MSEFSVCFISHHFKSPKILLDDIIKMTPNRSGKWKEMRAVTNPFEADVVVLLDGIGNIPYPEDRAYYFGQHPFGQSSFKPLTDKPAGRAFPNKEYLNPGEWWLKLDYDFLVSLEPPKKTKKIVAVSTYQNHKPTYLHRIQFLEELTKKISLDIYGRPEERFLANPLLVPFYKGVLGIKDYNPLLGEHIIGKDLLLDYEYSVENDVGDDKEGKAIKNYFSERFYDSLLCWCMPFYFGSDNVHDYIPKESFIYTDITSQEKRIQSSELVKEHLENNTRNKNIEAIREARELLLNKYQLWPFIYSKIRSL